MRIRKGIAAALSAATCTVFAAPPITQTEPVIVTATRFGDPARQFPIGVTVITEEDIRRSTAATVPELLRELPGVHTRDNSGSLDLQVDMRGFGIFGDQNTLVLLDGTRISENEQTTVNWSAIPLSAIERIEILRGSGSVLYGSGATGGTINIITKAPERNVRSAFVYGGVASYGTSEARAGLNIAGNDLGARFHASHLDTNNYRDNNRLRQSNAQADIRWTGDHGTIVLKTGADDQGLRLPGALSEAQIAANRRQAATPRDFSNRSGGYINLGGEFKVGAGEIAASLGYREKQTHAFIVGSNIDSDMRVWSFSPRLKLPHRLGGLEHKLIAGLDWDLWDFENQNVSAFLGTRRPLAFQRNRALYLQNTTAFTSALSVAAGARLHEVNYGVVDGANPAQAGTRQRNLSAYELAARYRVSPALSVYGKAGYSFRIPNVNDVYNLITGLVSLLEPQTSHDREIGLDIQSGPGRYRVALYHMDLNNELFFDPQAFVNRNLPPTRRYGMEAEGKWRLSSAVDLFANYTYAVSEFRSGNFGGIPLAGKDVPLVPRHAFNAGAGWAFAPRTRADVVLRYVGEQVFDSDETNVFGRKIPAYTTVDLKLAYENRGWLLAAGVKNLLNEKYYSYGVFDSFTPTFFAYPASERAMFISAQYTFR